MDKYRQAYDLLNERQKLAVDTTEGPVLVLAGPGTGKTQLLTTRVAHILASTDYEPQNILCLTFTESAAFEMRSRLIQMVGKSAYNITISTYHGFGNDLIKRYPDYFMHLYDFSAADDLTAYTVLSNVIKKLPYDNELKTAGSYIKDVLTLISDLKKAGILPDDLTLVAEHNIKTIQELTNITSLSLAGIKRIDKKCLSQFESLLQKSKKMNTANSPANITPLIEIWVKELEEALSESAISGKTNPITQWKNKWLAKDKENRFVPAGETQNIRLIDFATIYKQYMQALKAHKLYDYDDMILETIRALKSNVDFKYTLQERFMYVLLDEFQDTNASQLDLISLLTDSPVHEGRPNVLAVGDDDQGIYAFQGADHSNMLAFAHMYKNVEIINLTSNYRSHEQIIHFAHGISGQIEQRLHHSLENISKQLNAEIHFKDIENPVQRHEFVSDLAQYGWVSKQIQKMIHNGVSPGAIAILAPKHQYLEAVMPFLNTAKIPVTYEKRENVLEDPRIVSLIKMCELVISLHQKSFKIADSIWPEVLSYDFWDIPTETIWQLCWQANNQKKSLSQIIFKSKGSVKDIGLFFFTLANIAGKESLEFMLDYIVGVKTIKIADKRQYTSPMYNFYFSNVAEKNVSEYWNLLSSLSIIRQRLRDHSKNSKRQFGIAEFISFVNDHNAAKIKILNTNPYNEANESVQLMTAYKSKGLEFEHVFLLGCTDQIWGAASKKQSSKISIPANLSYIRYKGSSDDERLRLFYVASTRAKKGLYILSYTNDFASKKLTPLQYLNEYTADNNDIISPLVTEHFTVQKNDSTTPEVAELEKYWSKKHTNAKTIATFGTLLHKRLEKYQLSPTHINSFTDVIHGGPEAFFINTILRFPKAPSIATEYGNTIHKTLEWLGKTTNKNKLLPNVQEIHRKFGDILETKLIPKDEYQNYYKKGLASINAFVTKHGHEMLDNKIVYEMDFRDEGILLGNVHLTGKIDKLIIDEKNKQITIVDFKTGKIYDKWSKSEAVLHKYMQQLYFYKILIENSNTFKNYSVAGAYLEFMQPNKNGELCELHITFDETVMENIKSLITAVWEHIQKLDFPNIDSYPKTKIGIEEFEKDLLKK